MDDLLKYHGVDWVGFALTFASLHLLGSHRRSGFLLGAFASVAWISFAILTSSIALVIANSVFGLMNLRGWMRWRAIPSTGPDPAG